MKNAYTVRNASALAGRRCQEDIGMLDHPEWLAPTTAAAPLPAPAPATACEVRVLDDLDELLTSYRLRYDVYDDLGYIKHRNRSRLEIDPYDPYSIPFGAFDAASGELIGTLRLITDKVQAGYVQAVCRILADADDAELTHYATQPRRRPMPSIVSDGIARQIDAFNRDRFRVEELSRTIVRPDHRGSGVSRGLMEFGLACATVDGPVVLIGGCLAQHLPMYARYGYVQLPNTGLDYYDSVDQIAHAVVCRTDELPSPTREHVDELLRRMRVAAAQRIRSYVPPVYRLMLDGQRLRPEG